ncbi:MAG: flagellar motor switch protein FliN, partial [Rhodospirillaceae bacterium]|nr:flagellar motor switch protein FliN [Rhodospirillaceae bacterium]
MADEKNLELEELEETAPAPAPAKPDDDQIGFGGDEDIPDMPRNARDLEAVYDIPVQVSAVLG